VGKIFKIYNYLQKKGAYQNMEGKPLTAGRRGEGKTSGGELARLPSGFFFLKNGQIPKLLCFC